MNKFGPKSLACYATLHPDLQRVADEAIKVIDFSIVCGHRDEAEQTKAYQSHRSRLEWPNSRHNAVPSEAMDCVPVPLDWDDDEAFDDLATVILAAAKTVGVKIRWGGVFRSLGDAGHYELTG